MLQHRVPITRVRRRLKTYRYSNHGCGRQWPLRSSRPLSALRALSMNEFASGQALQGCAQGHVGHVIVLFKFGRWGGILLRPCHGRWSTRAPVHGPATLRSEAERGVGFVALASGTWTKIMCCSGSSPASQTAPEGVRGRADAPTLQSRRAQSRAVSIEHSALRRLAQRMHAATNANASLRKKADKQNARAVGLGLCRSWDCWRRKRSRRRLASGNGHRRSRHRRHWHHRERRLRRPRRIRRHLARATPPLRCCTIGESERQRMFMHHIMPPPPHNHGQTHRHNYCGDHVLRNHPQNEPPIMATIERNEHGNTHTHTHTTSFDGAMCSGGR